ncbi:MAG: cell surface protein SprA [Alloprevotella sp.]|nr:cell surface protein SprA [Alloprevotella sp.]
MERYTRQQEELKVQEQNTEADTHIYNTRTRVENNTAAAPDSVRFPVKKTAPQTEDGGDKRSGDLRDPENLKTEAFYDEQSNSYRYGTKLGEEFVETPFYMSGDEFQQWSIHRSMREYYKKKNADAFKEQGKEKFDFTDMKFDLGPANKVFGPGGVRIKTQGSAELKIGANMRNVDNPSLSERNRKVFGFDFDEKINVNVNAKVGDKMGMDFNYNSEAQFTFDAQKLKLRYEGKEDEIIKLIEAGNVSMPTTNSLIRGASSLFGVRTDLQFGKLKLSAILAQKKSSTQSVKSRGGVQLDNYEFSAHEYDADRHFFLAHYFRDRYDDNMAQLPTILSGITVNRIEVWVTNKTGQTTNTRNIVGFTDLAEGEHISNPMWSGSGTGNPYNTANTLYASLTALDATRDISAVTSTLDGIGLIGGTDYEKLESARLLSSSEYRVNTTLGYISLKSALRPDQVLAVAYEYTYRGQTYQVGEFSTDLKDNNAALFVKTLKNTANTPRQGNWDLMMKNVYALGADNVQQEKFRLDIKFLSDTSGVYLTYLPEASLKDRKLIQLLGLDRLDNNNKRNPNAYFDYVPGYTIEPNEGRIYFTSVEPFGSYMRKVIGDDAIADKYVFQELYDSTKTVAKQIVEKDKYVITGQYKATRKDEISLGATNVAKGSVRVTAGGITLTEGADYTVDYSNGIVRIVNKSLLDAGTAINVSLESNTSWGMQRKTMVGMNWEYDFSKDFMVGGTLLHLGEKPLTTKVSMGSEALNNTLWGLNMAYKKESQLLTNMLDKLPFIHATEPSSINFSAEFAHLIAGKNKGTQGNASYLDDFESASSDIDISNPKEWSISSVPSMFPESQYSNDPRYGYNRALLSWYYIDPLFTRRSSSLAPGHIKGDLAQLSDDDVREVYKSELFPNKKINYRESSTLDVLNLAYYPNERGPYNLDPDLDEDGHLNNPEKRWGGMMRKLDQSDFEESNIEYIEFWMMDPFMKARAEGRTFSGDLYFNLGEISEDILKDGKKFYESGLPIDGNPALYTETIWGRVPNQNTVTYAFNTSSGSRERQDVGYNGLMSSEEKDFGIYRDFLQQIQGRVKPEVYEAIQAAPSADRYHYFRGSDYDEERRSILDRYKYVNNPNGNSADADSSPESYSTAYKTTPDVEDINQDYTLNEYEKYYQYRVRIAPEEMQVGRNYIIDTRVAYPTRRDGSKPEVTWYLFRIPIESYERNVGNLSDFSSIRFIRMFMTGFQEPVVLRLGTLNLVRGEWRAYEQSLYAGKSADQSGTLEPSSVNFEENNEKLPVNYVIPPGISRVIDPGQDQLLENNEEALSLTVKNLASGEARAVYKNTTLDLRRYRHIQMFAHANSLEGQEAVENGQTSIFIRFGSDYKSNFYEYEIPLEVTPPGKYANSNAGARAVWPESNMLDIDLSLLTDTKRDRNREKSLGQASYGQLYSRYDPQRPANKVSVMGNPSLGEIRTIMIGVRNNSRKVQNVEVWANELRLQDFANSGGMAAQAQLNLKLSDVATVDLTGHMETEGFGGLEESVMQRRDDNLYQYSVTTNVQLGKFLPDKVKLNAPLYYSYSKEKIVPKYNPLDTDMPMEDALDGLITKEQKDSLNNIADRVVVSKNLSLTGIRFNIQTNKRTPMPYDPANFTFGYAHSTRHTTGETTVWEKDQNWKWSVNYSYSPNLPTFTPFKNLIKSKSNWFKILKEFGIDYVPQSLTFNSDITRSYYELQERDMENLENQSIPLTWSSDFLWNRSFAVRWDLTKSLHASFSSGTNAEVEQPYTAINKDLYPDRYTAWKDSVWQSIRQLGTPLKYAQNFEATWKLPLNKLPLFDWLTSDVAFRSSYNWTRGAELDNGTSMGHTIANSRDLSGNARLNMETLYNHIPFLKNTNKKFSASSTSRVTSRNNKSKPVPEKKNFEKEVQLMPDTTVTVQHNQRSKKLVVTAIDADGNRVRLRYKPIDNNKIEILTQDTIKLKLTVRPKRRKEDQTWYKVSQYAARFLMMVRSINVSYSNKFNMNVPGFLPQVGDIFGQRSGGAFAPGLDFAFGAVGENYLRRAADNGWLLMADSIITPATTNLNEDLQIRATLEPARDLKIDLSASRNQNRAKSIQYMFSGMPTTQTGSFTQTTISIRTAFERVGNADNGYSSRAFEQFRGSLEYYRQLVQAQYNGAAAQGLYDPEVGPVSPYSADVMIPAFLNAYTNGAHGKLDIFPTLARILPNWSLSYGGLAKLRRMKRTFKSFNLNHAYKSIYSVGAYNTFTSWQQYMGGLGFVSDVTTGYPVPSSMYDISTVSINETFSPLFGIDMTFLNNLSAKVELRKTRVVTLSMTNQQISETRSNDFVIGLGYKIADLRFGQAKRTVRERPAKGRRSLGDIEEEPDLTRNSRSNSKSRDGVSHDLNLRLDFSLRNQAALNRDIRTGLTQATSGNRALQISFSADYTLSKYLTLTAYYDRQTNTPLLTSSSYPTTTQDFGISIRFMLNR